MSVSQALWPEYSPCPLELLLPYRGRVTWQMPQTRVQPTFLLPQTKSRSSGSMSPSGVMWGCLGLGKREVG